MPAAFFAATAWVSWYNATHEASKILIPLVDTLFPAAAEDPATLGDRSVQVLFFASLGVLALTVAEHVAALRRGPDRSGPDAGQ